MVGCSEKEPNHDANSHMLFRCKQAFLDEIPECLQRSAMSLPLSDESGSGKVVGQIFQHPSVSHPAVQSLAYAMY